MSRLPARSRTLAVAFACTACVAAADAPPAAASNPLQKACGVAGLFMSGALGKACSAISNGGKLASAGKKLLSGHLGGALKSVLGGSSTKSATTTAVGLAAIGAWVLGGAKVALHETVGVLGKTTTPQLRSTWFSSTYWRMAGIAAVLTLPFLFAAAIQALMRSDLALLIRAAFGYLPLAMLAIGVAAPVTMLLLSASDELSAAVSSAAGNSGAHYLAKASGIIGSLTVIAGSPFLAFLIGVLVVAGALTLWMELLMREAAVYVIVLMLPLVFAAFVWPARRIWAIRAVELLVALILSKFAIVAVLSLGGAALTSGLSSGITGWLAGVVLLFMGAFAPWALLRLVPLSELAASAVGPLRGEMRAPEAALVAAQGYAGAAEDWAASKTSHMRREADETAAGQPPADAAGPADVAPDGSDPANLVSDGGEQGDLTPEGREPGDLTSEGGESADPATDDGQPADLAPTESRASSDAQDTPPPARDLARGSQATASSAGDAASGGGDGAPGAQDAAPGAQDAAPDARVGDTGPPPDAARANEDAHLAAPSPRAEVDGASPRSAEDELPPVALGLEGFPPDFQELRRRLGIEPADGQDPDPAPPASDIPGPTPPPPGREEGSL